MKIRTVTTGIHLQSIDDLDKIKIAAEFNYHAKSAFTEAGYEVQTTRVTTNTWEEYSSGLSKGDLLNAIGLIDKTCQSLQVDFFNIGYADTPKNIVIIPDIIKSTTAISCSAKIGDISKGIDFENAKNIAKAIKKIADETENGYGNFRFCGWSNCQPGIPFFPVSYHEGSETTFAIGLECSDLVYKAFKKSGNLAEAEQNLKKIFDMELQKIEHLAKEMSTKHKPTYFGIDTSVAPSLDPDESIAFAYEKLGFGNFGNHGTLTISSIITKVLKDLSVKTCGYSGLMLPVCEDYGLATRANEESYNITNLLLYSAVCGCGLDTLPIPGDTPPDKIEAILLDIASLSIKLNKPLSARLLPATGKKAGEMTTFNSPYLMDCKILKVQ